MVLCGGDQHAEVPVTTDSGSKREGKIMSASQTVYLHKGLNHGTSKCTPPPSLRNIFANPEMSLDIHIHSYVKKTHQNTQQKPTCKNQPFCTERTIDGELYTLFPSSLSNVVVKD